MINKLVLIEKVNSFSVLGLCGSFYFVWSVEEKHRPRRIVFGGSPATVGNEDSGERGTPATAEACSFLENICQGGNSIRHFHQNNYPYLYPGGEALNGLVLLGDFICAAINSLTGSLTTCVANKS